MAMRRSAARGELTESIPSPALFVLGSISHAAPAVVETVDVQPLTQQLQSLSTILVHDPLFHGSRSIQLPGNSFLLGCVSPPCLRETRAAAVAQASPLLFPSRTHKHEP